MFKTSIIVPEGIRFLSQWKDFKLYDFPYILDKKIPGCGFTEWCLSNNENIILCCPRKILLKNKYNQHKKDVLYVRNKFEDGIDRKVSFVDESSIKEEELNLRKERKNYFNKLTAQINSYIDNRWYHNEPVKLLVTYDSFPRLYSILVHNQSFPKFRVVVDEMQAIFTDSAFKSTTEMGFIKVLKKIQKVCFVSATPMLEKYLDRLPDFNSLPYYELLWKELPNKFIRPIRCKSIIHEAKKVISRYREGKFESKFVNDCYGNINQVFSKEAVIFLNSVNNLINIIKKTGLEPEEVTIICADTLENQTKIDKKLNRGRTNKSKFTIDEVPLRNQSRKMFTFCTRTVYLGSDFYSDNARSFVFSDANLETLSVDIRLDLPQILGRQRLDENPWKDEVTFYFIPLSFGNKKPKEVFENHLKNKINSTNLIIKGIEQIEDVEARSKLIEKCEDSFRLRNYTKDYIAIDTVYESILGEDGIFRVKKRKKLVFNNLVNVAEERAFDIQQNDYANMYTVYNALNKITSPDVHNCSVTDFLLGYEQCTKLSEKLRYICLYEFPDDKIKEAILKQIPEEKVKELYLTAGPNLCRAFGYNLTKIRLKLGIISFDKVKLAKDIISRFIVGEKYSIATIKEELLKIYKKNNYNKPTATANELNEWLYLKNISFYENQPDGNRKRVRGFLVLGAKSI